MSISPQFWRDVTLIFFLDAAMIQSARSHPILIFNAETIWVNYYNSLTWMKAIWGWYPLLINDSQWGRSEVVTIYPEANSVSETSRATLPCLNIWRRTRVWRKHRPQMSIEWAICKRKGMLFLEPPLSNPTRPQRLLCTKNKWVQ